MKAEGAKAYEDGLGADFLSLRLGKYGISRYTEDDKCNFFAESFIESALLC